MNRLDKNAFHQRLGEFMIQTKTFSNVKVRLTLFLDPYPWIFGTVTERNFRNEKSKAQKHIQIDSMLRFDFFGKRAR